MCGAGGLYVLTPQDTEPCWSGPHGREGPRESRTGLFLFALSWKKPRCHKIWL